MPLGALERGMGLMSQVREGLGDVTVPTLLIYGDADQVVDKANGPFVLEGIKATAVPGTSTELPKTMGPRGTSALEQRPPPLRSPRPARRTPPRQRPGWSRSP